jgi:hypothetical protein
MPITIRLAAAITAVLLALIGALWAVESIDGATAQTAVWRTLLVVAIFTAASLVVQSVTRGRSKS